MKKTILIAEDDKQVRRSLTRILKEVGYSVVEASNGKEVLQDLKRSDDFCLLLTDIVMPEMEGLELITHLKRYHPKLPIVAMSGSFEGVFLNAARMLGATETLQKPFERAALLAALESACA
jgi:two-component system response regulator FixJ